MKELKSELTWSFSRSRLFEECRRAYYYHYYASWGGWSENSDEFVRKAYILKNMRNINIWVGDVVHQIIKWIFESKNISCEEALKKSKQLLVRTWEQSRSKAWLKNPKNNLNLFEHYYNCEPERDTIAKQLKKVARSIRNVYESGLFEYFSSLPPQNILSIDTMDHFIFEGIKAFAVPDFAIKDRKYVLYDWKTGKKSDKDIRQLSCYVLYAVNKWSIDSQDIQIVPVYIAQEKAGIDAFENIDIDEVRSRIACSISEMKKVLIDIESNKADIALCPKTDDSWRCVNCRFKEICR